MEVLNEKVKYAVQDTDSVETAVVRSSPWYYWQFSILVPKNQETPMNIRNVNPNIR